MRVIASILTLITAFGGTPVEACIPVFPTCVTESTQLRSVIIYSRGTLEEPELSALVTAEYPEGQEWEETSKSSLVHCPSLTGLRYDQVDPLGSGDLEVFLRDLIRDDVPQTFRQVQREASKLGFSLKRVTLPADYCACDPTQVTPGDCPPDVFD